MSILKHSYTHGHIDFILPFLPPHKGVIPTKKKSLFSQFCVI